MTNLRTHRWFTLPPARSRGVSNSKKLSLPAMICIVCLFCAAAAIPAPAQSVYFTTLTIFNGADGAGPSGPLVQGTDGNLYGTTVQGGANDNNNNCPSGCGTLFRISPAGMLTTLYSFCSQPDCADGIGPLGPLVQASDGNFYGITSGGGGYSYGTVFKITSLGALTTLYSFCLQPNCTDGVYPDAGPIQASDGNFYGTTLQGGTHDSGTVFRITPAGTLTSLYSFCSQQDCADGSNPWGPLVQASDGNFYGTTLAGGANYCGSGLNCGTVFRITPAGALTTLHSFDGWDGEFPEDGLVQGTDGSIYGTTHGATNVYSWCVSSYGCGTVFKITLGGTLTTLLRFDGSNGQYPQAGLVQASDGNFYGTTPAGGNLFTYCGLAGCGTVFKITATGMLTSLYKFCAAGPPCTDGYAPHSALLQAPNGSFYGTADGGGTDGSGTVFRIGLVHTCPTCRP